MATQYNQYLLNDANPDLIAVWVSLKQRPQEFIAAAQSYFRARYHSEPAYLQVRSEFNELSDRFERAVRFVYLNKFGFNGVFRVNGSGLYNVPHGWPQKSPRFPAEEMKEVAARLSQCEFLNGSYVAALERAGPGDVCYCDPPYAASARGRCFTAYTQSKFGWGDQLELVGAAESAARRGAMILISNHDTPETRELYRGWRVHAMGVRRSLSGANSGRGMASELVAMLGIAT